MFQGQYLDSESGLYYLRARYYDPTTGQLLTVDPALAATNQPYAFTAGDPINGSDPSGLMLLGSDGGAFGNVVDLAIHEITVQTGASLDQARAVTLSPTGPPLRMHL